MDLLVTAFLAVFIASVGFALGFIFGFMFAGDFDDRKDMEGKR